MYATDPSLNGVAWIFGDQDNLGNFYNDVWKTVDNGRTWTNTFQNGVYGVPGPSQRAYGCLVYVAGRLLVMSGRPRNGWANDAWYSFNDGASWHSNFSDGYYPGRWWPGCTATPSGAVFLAGGEGQGSAFNDVWRSLDYGQSFTQMTANAPWAARYVYSNALIAFNGQIFLVGGSIFGDLMDSNDVWSSTDGASWIQRLATGAAGSFTKRFGYASFVRGNELYLVFGYSWNDIWSTTAASNGTVWTSVPTTISQQSLEYCGVVVNATAVVAVTVFCGSVSPASAGQPGTYAFVGVLDLAASTTSPPIATTTSTAAVASTESSTSTVPTRSTRPPTTTPSPAALASTTVTVTFNYSCALYAANRSSINSQLVSYLSSFANIDPARVSVSSNYSCGSTILSVTVGKPTSSSDGGSGTQYVALNSSAVIADVESGISSGSFNVPTLGVPTAVTISIVTCSDGSAAANNDATQCPPSTTPKPATSGSSLYTFHPWKIWHASSLCLLLVLAFI